MNVNGAPAFSGPHGVVATAGGTAFASMGTYLPPALRAQNANSQKSNKSAPSAASLSLQNRADSFAPGPACQTANPTPIPPTTARGAWGAAQWSHSSSTPAKPREAGGLPGGTSGRLPDSAHTVNGALQPPHALGGSAPQSRAIAGSASAALTGGTGQCPEPTRVTGVRGRAGVVSKTASLAEKNPTEDKVILIFIFVFIVIKIISTI